jgi:hypothetical protein
MGNLCKFLGFALFDECVAFVYVTIGNISSALSFVPYLTSVPAILSYAFKN